MELEKYAEKSPEGQRFALLIAYGSSENPEVLFRLGECCRDGCGTEKDDEAEALRFSEAAARGE